MLFLRDDAGDVVDNSEVVMSNHMERDGVGSASLSCPLGANDAVGESLFQRFGIGAISAVNLDASA